MEFVVTSREGIEEGVRVRSSYVVISIRDPQRRRAKVRKQAGLRDVLFLAFDDAEPSSEMTIPSTIKLMTILQSRQILQFVEKYKTAVGTIVVHCEQGMSRSPAVAAALCKVMGGDDKQFWEDYQPNQFVYELVKSASSRL